MSLKYVLFLAPRTGNTGPEERHLKEIQGRRNTKIKNSRHSQIQNNEDVHQRVLLTCEHSAVDSINVCCL
jgi:hypothetical protein